MSIYGNELKKKLCTDICLNGKSTIKTAEEFNVPLKTLEKWITSFNKNCNCFDSSDNPDDFRIISPSSTNRLYDDLSDAELKELLMKKDIEITRLKKGYFVKGGGTAQKVFITFSKKNIK